jgi:hypothetical protein
MIRTMLPVAILTLGMCAGGCAHKVTPEEIRAKSQQLAGNGRSRFYEELAERNVTWYVSGAPTSAGFNAETGLPEQPVSSLPAGMQSSEFVKAHNDAVLEYIRDNGPIPGSFLPWENDLFHQAAYWSAHADQLPQALRPGQPVSSPGGQYTLTLQDSGGAQILIQSESGQKRSAAPAGAAEPTADVIFGPPGSDLAYTRWPAGGGESIYAAMNLRDGRWIVVQRGGR